MYSYLSISLVTISLVSISLVTILLVSTSLVCLFIFNLYKLYISPRENFESEIKNNLRRNYKQKKRGFNKIKDGFNTNVKNNLKKFARNHKL
jgi:hypothetical protein